MFDTEVKNTKLQLPCKFRIWSQVEVINFSDGFFKRWVFNGNLVAGVWYQVFGNSVVIPKKKATWY
jgi:hypothetical protein